MSDDPDAMWRPGYTGPVVYPRPGSRPGPGRRRRLALVAAGIVALGAVAAGAVALVATDPGRPATSATGARIPSGSRERWSVTLDAPDVPTVGGSTRTIVVVTSGGSPAVVALDTSTGGERWSVAPSAGRVDAVDLLGDVAVVSTVDADGDRTLRALDLASGRERWELPAEDDGRPAVDAGQVVVVHGPGGSEPARSVQWIDLVTGEVESEIEGGDITLSRSGAQRRSGDEIEVFDRQPVRSRGVVDLAALGLAGQPGVRVVATDAGAVVATRTAVLLVDGDRVLSAIVLNPRPAADGRVGLQALDADGRFVAVDQGDGLLVLSTDGGALRALWKDSAWLVDWSVDADRRLLAVALVTGSIVSMPPQVVDAATGRTLWDGPASVQQASPLRTFADNGFIVVATPRSGARSPAVVGYDLDRVEMWRRPLEPGSDFELVDGGLVTIHPDTEAGTTTLTYYS